MSGVRAPATRLGPDGRPDPAQCEPYAVEAHYFTESRLLQVSTLPSTNCCDPAQCEPYAVEAHYFTESRLLQVSTVPDQLLWPSTLRAICCWGSLLYRVTTTTGQYCTRPTAVTQHSASHMLLRLTTLQSHDYYRSVLYPTNCCDPAQCEPYAVEAHYFTESRLLQGSKLLWPSTVWVICCWGSLLYRVTATTGQYRYPTNCCDPAQCEPYAVEAHYFTESRLLQVRPHICIPVTVWTSYIILFFILYFLNLARRGGCAWVEQ
jgi:hypothetical protein